jgi:predicted nucleic acid-binding protein
MGVIFDTNVWVALFNINDAHHEKAKELFFENSVVLIPEYVVLETTTVLHRKGLHNFYVR